LLADLPGITLPRVPHDREHVYYLYTLRVAGRVAGHNPGNDPGGATRSDIVQQRLADRGIASVVYYLFRCTSSALRFSGRQTGDLRISERAAREVLSIPLYPELTPRRSNASLRRFETRFATDRKNTPFQM